MTIYPDFYLASSEGYNLENPRKCWIEKKVSNKFRSDLFLVRVNPLIIYNDPQEGEIFLHEVIIAAKHFGYPIIPIRSWPTYVYVARMKKELPNNVFILDDKELQIIALAELYPTEESAKNKSLGNKT